MPKRKPAKSKRGLRSRRVETREVRQSFLIVCEGAKTEPNYFKKYRVPQLVVEVIGLGANTISVVEKAIEERDSAKANKEPFDQVWCVFDRDSFPAKTFNRALELAATNGIHVAYSNEAFELWYLLHFGYMHSAIHRSEYIRRLKDKLGAYQKNSDDMYDILLPDRETAIKNAQRLLEEYDPPTPEQDNPSTRVHILVQELLKNSPGA